MTTYINTTILISNMRSVLSIILIGMLSACVSNQDGRNSPTTPTASPAVSSTTISIPNTTTTVPTSSSQTNTTSVLPPALGSFDGYGNQVTGGQGLQVVMVTTLNDSGTGSFREAASGGNRTIKFAVAGTISLNSILKISGQNVTIDGFSAPSPGITLSGNSLQIGGNPKGPDSTGSNIILQGIRIRDSVDKSILISYNAHDVVVDHCSFARGLDEEMALTEGSYNITVSWSIIADNRGPGGVLLSYDTGHVSMHHNIFSGNKDRNPILTGDYTRNYSSGPPHSDPLADVRYNIVWNYGIGTYVISSGATLATGNIVANLYRNNGVINQSDVVVRAAYGAAQQADAYIAGNVSVQDARGCAFSYNNNIPCYTYPTVNSMNNHAEYTAPSISGPAKSNQQGLLNEWGKVKSGAGPVQFPDDAEDAAVRGAIAIPDITVFTQPWNL